jgi:hypothetical protein
VWYAVENPCRCAALPSPLSPCRHTGIPASPEWRPRVSEYHCVRLQYLADIMPIWLEHDPVALVLLVIGLAAVELLAFII